MRPLASLLRANCFAFPRKPFFSTPPRLVYPTKSFTTTPHLHRYQAPKRKQQVPMAHDMTTLKGKPFDRASLESLMRVRIYSLCPRISAVAVGVILTSRSAASSTRLHSISTAVFRVSTTMAQPAVPSPTTLSTYGGNTLYSRRTCSRWTAPC